MKLFKPIFKHWSYLADFLVIVLGIVVALSLDNWNQEKINKKEESIFLQELGKTLKADLRDARGNRQAHQESVDAIDTLLYAFDNDIPYNDAMIKPFSSLLFSVLPIQSEAQFRELQSKGFDMITNDSMRENLISLYNKEYQRIKAAEIDLPHFQNFDLLFGYIMENFFVSDHQEIATGNMLPIEPISYQHVSTDHQFRLLLEQTQLWRKWIIRVGYDIAIKKQEELILYIEAELGIEPTDSDSSN